MKIKTILLTFAIFSPITAFATSASCPQTTGINVLTAKRVLTICKQGVLVKSFNVALGFKGVGKKHTGDNKTPVGLYGLSYPRKSSQFKVFIPILYPTPQQRAAGYTGRDVGIHGPNQTSSLLGWLGNLPYSTRGCVAVGKNSHIDYVANWIKTNPGAKVLIV